MGGVANSRGSSWMWVSSPGSWKKSIKKPMVKARVRYYVFQHGDNQISLVISMLLEYKSPGSSTASKKREREKTILGRTNHKGLQSWTKLLRYLTKFQPIWVLQPICSTPSPISMLSLHVVKTMLKRSRINRPYSYSHGWTGTGLQSKLMRGNLFKCKYF